jgi:hypothetical protein
MIIIKKKSKYSNKKVMTDGIKFDSKKEATRFKELKVLEKAGVIKDLELQKKFELQPSFKLNGKTIRAIHYIADFYYFDTKENKWIVEDCKGYRNEVYKLKKKMFEYKYQMEILES